MRCSNKRSVEREGPNGNRCFDTRSTDLQHNSQDSESTTRIGAARPLLRASGATNPLTDVTHPSTGRPGVTGEPGRFSKLTRRSSNGRACDGSHPSVTPEGCMTGSSPAAAIGHPVPDSSRPSQKDPSATVVPSGPTGWGRDTHGPWVSVFSGFSHWRSPFCRTAGGVLLFCCLMTAGCHLHFHVGGTYGEKGNTHATAVQDIGSSSEPDSMGGRAQNESGPSGVLDPFTLAPAGVRGSGADAND